MLLLGWMPDLWLIPESVEHQASLMRLPNSAGKSRQGEPVRGDPWYGRNKSPIVGVVQSQGTACGRADLTLAGAGATLYMLFI